MYKEEMNNLDKVKKHINDHKNLYVVGGVCVSVDVSIGLLIKSRPTSIINTVAPVFNNDNSSKVIFGGYSHKIVKCLETGQLWESVKSAAENIGVSSPMLSKVLNGHSDMIKGLHYEIIGLSTNS